MVEGSLLEGQGLLGPDGTSRGLGDNVHSECLAARAEGTVPSCRLATGHRMHSLQHGQPGRRRVLSTPLRRLLRLTLVFISLINLLTYSLHSRTVPQIFNTINRGQEVCFD